MSEEETTIDDNSIVLEHCSTNTTSVLTCLQHQQKSPFKERIAAIDLRIGLLWLGEEGRKLLAEYISHDSSSEQSFREGYSNGCEDNNLV